MSTIYLLAGDIGGTYSRFGLYTYDRDQSICLWTKSYFNENEIHSQDDDFAEKLVAPFLQYCWDQSSTTTLVSLESCEIVACLACAGYVRNNSVTIGNLHDIVIDGNKIEQESCNPFLERIKVCRIINDFIAQGYGCLLLNRDGVDELIPGSYNKVEEAIKVGLRGPIVCIGAGTGLGQSFLTPDENGKYTCFPSEGGHVEHAPRTELDAKLMEYLKVKYGDDRAGVGRLVSGRGLASVYEFLAKELPTYVNKETHEAFLKDGKLQAKVVAEHAMKTKDNMVPKLDMRPLDSFQQEAFTSPA